MELKFLKLWMVLALILSITACSSDSDYEIPSNTDPVVEDNELMSISLTPSEQQLVTNGNDFAFNLFRQVSDEKASIVLSPISITYALGMLNNGADGETLKQINKVLGFSSADEVNDFCKKMLTEAPKLDQLTKVLIANTIFMNKDYVLKTSFVQKANDYYNAQPETRDFGDGKTLDVINQWASDHTEKMIDKVLDADTFDPNAVSYLLNAIYFKGAWTAKFDKSETKDEEFQTDGEQANPKVPMMHQQKTFNYTETEDYQVVCLPYGNEAYNMTILLPCEEKTVSQVLSGLTADNWAKMQKKLAGTRVDVKLPRFESKTDINLIEIMNQLGMPNAFLYDKAEFPNFCNKPTFINLMKQVAKIKLDEEGTEAAAVTIIGTNVACGPEGGSSLITFHANRPFLYVISEQSTGAILFIGQYNGI